jgi:hypothetical protein
MNGNDMKSHMFSSLSTIHQRKKQLQAKFKSSTTTSQRIQKNLRLTIPVVKVEPPAIIEGEREEKRRKKNPWSAVLLARHRQGWGVSSFNPRREYAVLSPIPTAAAFVWEPVDVPG